MMLKVRDTLAERGGTMLASPPQTNFRSSFKQMI
jgi:hypothetical protein